MASCGVGILPEKLAPAVLLVLGDESVAGFAGALIEHAGRVVLALGVAACQRSIADFAPHAGQVPPELLTALENVGALRFRRDVMGQPGAMGRYARDLATPQRYRSAHAGVLVALGAADLRRLCLESLARSAAAGGAANVEALVTGLTGKLLAFVDALGAVLEIPVLVAGVHVAQVGSLHIDGIGADDVAAFAASVITFYNAALASILDRHPFAQYIRAGAEPPPERGSALLDEAAAALVAAPRVTMREGFGRYYHALAEQLIAGVLPTWRVVDAFDECGIIAYRVDGTLLSEIRTLVNAPASSGSTETARLAELFSAAFGAEMQQMVRDCMRAQFTLVRSGGSTEAVDAAIVRHAYYERGAPGSLRALLVLPSAQAVSVESLFELPAPVGSDLRGSIVVFDGNRIRRRFGFAHDDVRILECSLVPRCPCEDDAASPQFAGVAS